MEDAGYYCVDNMPVTLLPDFLEMPSDHLAGFSGLVFGMDLRDENLVPHHASIIDEITAAEVFPGTANISRPTEQTLVMASSFSSTRLPF